jgi:hypothetical protein
VSFIIIGIKACPFVNPPMNTATESFDAATDYKKD